MENKTNRCKIINIFRKSGLLAVCLLYLAGMTGCSIRLASSVPTASPTAVATEVPTPDLQFSVTIKITGPEGALFSENEVETEEGVTAFSLLQSVCEKKGLALDYTGSIKRGTVYVTGIGGFYEKMYGAGSGWTYYVNDAMPNVSVSSYKLKNRDVIEWRYVK